MTTFIEHTEKNNIVEDILRFSLRILPVVLCLTLVNYFIDPANIYKHRKFDADIFSSLKRGLNVGFDITMSQVDEVYIKKKQIESFDSPKDIVVLGSSRSFTLNQSNFPENSFYNASVSSCKIQDMIGIYNLLRKNDKKPKVIFLGLGPDQFVLKSSLKKDLISEFEEILPLINKRIKWIQILKLKYAYFKHELRRIFNLLSPAYFQDSIKYFNFKLKSRNQLKRSGGIDAKELSWLKQNWKETKSSIANGGVIFPDGSRQWRKKYLTNDTKITLAHVKYNMRFMSRLKLEKHKILKKNRRHFESFLEYLKSEKVAVVFFLPPYHSYEFDYEVARYQRPAVLSVEKYLKDLSKKYNIKIIGSFNPHDPVSGGDQVLVDHHHPSRERVGLILRGLLNH